MKLRRIQNYEPDGLGASVILLRAAANFILACITQKIMVWRWHHREQPTLENPGTSYDGRSIYTHLGLEGVEHGVVATSRKNPAQAFMRTGDG